MKYNSLIIGAGKIGSEFDGPNDENILTHAHSYLKHEGFNLVGFVDSDFDKAAYQANKWGVSAYKSIEEAFKKTPIDVVSVCVPDSCHYTVLKELSDYPVKLVFAEKPLTKNLQEAEKLVEIYKTIPLCLNYSRRFMSEYRNVLDLGQMLVGTGFYGKGLLHNGSHMIDFLECFIGEIESSKFVEEIFDFYKDDSSVSSVLTLDNGSKFYLNAIDCNNFSIFEMEFIFQKGKVRVLDAGNKIEIYKIKNCEIFQGYKILEMKEMINIPLNKSMLFAMNNIFNFLSGEEPLKCTIKDGLKVMEIVNKIREGSKP